MEWPTLIFFVGLFMVIAGAEETGLIQVIAKVAAILDRSFRTGYSSMNYY